jgi:hypothetical protein
MEGIEFQEHQKKLLGKLLETARTKQREYNGIDNAFHNFEDAAGMALVNERESIAWEYCVKHLQSVRDIIKHVEVGGDVNGYPTQDLIDEKFGDVIVYMTLIHGMITDRINNNKNKNENTK